MAQDCVRLSSGNYDSYLRTRAELEDAQMKKHKWEQDQISHMKEYIARFGHGSAKLARQAQSKEKTLEKMVRSGLTEAVAKESVVRLHFTDVGKLPPPVLQFINVTFGYTPDRVLYSNVRRVPGFPLLCMHALPMSPRMQPPSTSDQGWAGLQGCYLKNCSREQTHPGKRSPQQACSWLKVSLGFITGRLVIAVTYARLLHRVFCGPQVQSAVSDPGSINGGTRRPGGPGRGPGQPGGHRGPQRRREEHAAEADDGRAGAAGRHGQAAQPPQDRHVPPAPHRAARPQAHAPRVHGPRSQLFPLAFWSLVRAKMTHLTFGTRAHRLHTNSVPPPEGKCPCWHCAALVSMGRSRRRPLGSTTGVCCSIGSCHRPFLVAVNGWSCGLQLKEFPEGTTLEGMRRAVGRFGITGKAQTQPILQLSDGLRSRLVFAWLAYKTPHVRPNRDFVSGIPFLE